jgi:hypothetical protein
VVISHLKTTFGDSKKPKISIGEAKMSVKGGNTRPFPLPKGIATVYAEKAKAGLANKILEAKGDEKPNGVKGKPKERWDLYIFENCGGMREIGITALDPPAGYMSK